MTGNMPNRRLRALAFALVVPLAFAGCDKFEARTAFKQANVSYKNENYREAIAGYERGLALDPEAKKVWRSLGLAAMAIYRPGDTSPQNLEYAKKALDAFEKFAAAFPEDPKVQEYILTILMGSERYDEAMKRLRAIAQKNPNDKQTLQAITSILVRQKKLDEADAWVKSLGSRADSTNYYTVGVYAWDIAYRDPMIPPEERLRVVELGITALRKSVQMTPDSFDSNVYLNLILREKAKLELDPVKQQELIAEAITYQDKAKLIVQQRKAQAAAAAPAAGS
jgi:tetratricopeptide (TPR) repeat protein